MLDFAPIIIATALAAGLAAMILLDGARFLAGHGQTPRTAPDEAGVHLVFDRESLVNLTPEAELLMAGSLGDTEAPDLKAAILALSPRFPDLDDVISGIGSIEKRRLLASDGSAHLAIQRNGDSLRLDLEPIETNGGRLVLDVVEFESVKKQLGTLRSMANALPFPMWYVDAGGAPAWVNRAYLDHCAAYLDPEALSRWPPPRLFGSLGESGAEAGADYRAGVEAGPQPATRVWLNTRADRPLPFEVTASPHSGGTLYSAVPADSAVRAETALRDFVQTLTKTFAQIDIGLAVFSRDRRLVLFNPALGELTGLRPEALAVRPTLFEFLDTLRDRRIMPEPKNYKAWRQHLADMRTGGSDVNLMETWQLADGRTFRVTAIPQSEGALALLFEDITRQMVQSRNFRGTLELHQLILDRREEAIAVFAPEGALILCNERYETLWETRVFETAAPISLDDCLDTWRGATHPTPAWGDFPGDAAAEPWAAKMQMSDGRPLSCRVSWLSGGCRMVEFRVGNDDPRQVPRRPPQRRLQLQA